MSVVLLRVDDRLIHGQVVVGWGQFLSPDRIVLADDTIAQDAWEAELYRTAVPDDVEVEFTSIVDTARRFAEWDQSPERIVVLVRDIPALMQLCDMSRAVRRVNLGGVHRSGDRVERLPYIFLSEDELEQLKRLERQGVEVTAQDLPTAMPVTLQDLA